MYGSAAYTYGLQPQAHAKKHTTTDKIHMVLVELEYQLRHVCHAKRDSIWHGGEAVMPVLDLDHPASLA
jgi:hypothetical protein